MPRPMHHASDELPAGHHVRPASDVRAAAASVLGSAGLPGIDPILRIESVSTEAAIPVPRLQDILDTRIGNTELRLKFLSAWVDSNRLYSHIGIAPPGFATFADNGYDLAKYAKLYEGADKNGRQPEVVIAASGASPSMWKSMYENINTKSTSGGVSVKGGGLRILDAVAAEWKKVDFAPAMVPVVRDGTGNYNWTLRIVAGTAAANVMGAPLFGGNEVKLTVAEYLTMQASRLSLDKKPLDLVSGTWLHGLIDDSRRVVCGGWQNGQVLIDSKHYLASSMELGNRFTYWEKPHA